MTDSFSKFIFYIILLVITSLIILLLFPDFRSKTNYNDELREKLENIIATNQDNEVIIMGSSKIKHHLNDELFSKRSNKNSINLGVAATNPPETYIIFEELLKEGKLKNKTVILEVRAVKEISYANWWRARSTYWLNQENLNLSLKLIEASKTGMFRKQYAKASYILAHLSNSIGLNILSNDLFSLSNNQAIEFFSTLENKEIDCDYLNQLNQNTHVVIDQKEEMMDNAHFDYLSNLILKSEKSDCHLILYLAEANLDWQIRELQPIFENLPEQNKIAIIDSRTYPFLNDCSLKNNVTHFDKEGADSLTYAMAKEYLKIANKNN